MHHLIYDSKKRGSRPNELIYFNCLINNHKIKAFLDTGANITCVSKSIFNKLSLQIIKNSSIPIRQLNSNTKSLGRVKINLKIGNIEKRIEAHVIQNLESDLLLGLDSAQLFNLSLNLNDRRLTQNDVQLNHNNFVYNSINMCQNQFINERQKQQLSSLINQYRSVFSQSKDDIGRIQIEKHRISLKHETPIYRRPYRTSIEEQRIIDEQVAILERNGLVRESTSPYSFPVTLAHKKGEGKTRFCVDYRLLNEITVNDPQPIPRIEDILDKLANRKFFTKIDISSGYWHVPMLPEDIHKTAFSTHNRHLEWTVMPFGLKNAPATFQRVIRQIIFKYKLRNVENYFDDIIVFSETFDEHLNDLEQVFKACLNENVKLKESKCEFAKPEISYLGHQISHNHVQPNTENIESIQNFPRPKDIKQLQRFLGMENVYQKFIPRHAMVRRPLTNLLAKETPWKWDDDCEKAFLELKRLLVSKPILRLYDPNLPCTIYCDASGVGIGAVLKQTQLDKTEMPIAYFSRKLLKHEEHYTITELECLSIVEALRKWHCYVHGKTTTVVTDHAALQWLKSCKRLNGRLFRWSLHLSTYDLIVKYKTGSGNYEADALSRAPIVHFISTEELKDKQETMIDKEKYLNIDGLRIRRRKGTDKLVVPPELRKRILEECHQRFGHVGVKKMIKLISPTYYWPNLIVDISNFNKHCDVCQRNKKTKTKKFATLDLIPPADEPFQLISIDTVLGLSKYGSTKNLFHLVTDHCTRYAWVFPDKSTTASSYINVVKQMLKVGPIKQILTDRAAGFLSNSYKKFLEKNNIKRLLTSPEHPQCNGLNERTNQELCKRLRCKINDSNVQNKNWARLMGQVVEEFNNSPHEVTGFSPAFLLYGKKPYEQYRINPGMSIENARRLALQNILNYHQKNKIIYDKNHQTPTFKEGDLVLHEIAWHPNNGKLTPVMEGPYKILRKVSEVSYEIDKPNRPEKKTASIIHSSKLRFYHPPDGFRIREGTCDA